jgi:hypothetical protein
MKGHGTKFGRKKEMAVAALLTHRNIDEAAKAVGVAPNTTAELDEGPDVCDCISESAGGRSWSGHRPILAK